MTEFGREILAFKTNHTRLKYVISKTWFATYFAEYEKSQWCMIEKVWFDSIFMEGWYKWIFKCHEIIYSKN